jgi:hypothetical protein
MNVVSTTEYKDVNCFDAAVALSNVNAALLDKEVVSTFARAPVVVVICPTSRLANELTERAASVFAVKAITDTGHGISCAHAVRADGVQLVSMSAERVATGSDILRELASERFLRAVIVDEIELYHRTDKCEAVLQVVGDLCAHHAVPIAVTSQLMTHKLGKLLRKLELPKGNTIFVEPMIKGPSGDATWNTVLRHNIALDVKVTRPVQKRQSHSKSTSGDHAHPLFHLVAQLVLSTSELLTVENARAIVFCSNDKECNAIFFMLIRYCVGALLLLRALINLPVS